MLHAGRSNKTETAPFFPSPKPHQSPKEPARAPMSLCSINSNSLVSIFSLQPQLWGQLSKDPTSKPSPGSLLTVFLNLCSFPPSPLPVACVNCAKDDGKFTGNSRSENSCQTNVYSFPYAFIERDVWSFPPISPALRSLPCS